MLRHFSLLVYLRSYLQQIRNDMLSTSTTRLYPSGVVYCNETLQTTESRRMHLVGGSDHVLFMRHASETSRDGSL